MSERSALMIYGLGGLGCLGGLGGVYGLDSSAVVILGTLLSGD